MTGVNCHPVIACVIDVVFSSVRLNHATRLFRYFSLLTYSSVFSS